MKNTMLLQNWEKKVLRLEGFPIVESIKEHIYLNYIELINMNLCIIIIAEHQTYKSLWISPHYGMI